MGGLCWISLGAYHHYSFLVGLLLTTDMVKCWSIKVGNIPWTREILVKLYSEENLNVLRSESSRFGLEYVEKVSKHVHSFRDSTSKKKDIDGFRQSFSTAIAEIQEIKYCSVQTYPRLGTSLSSREEKFATLFKKMINKQCSPYFGMGIEEAWRYNFTGAGVNIAILDVGVEMDHPDLKQNINTQLGYNFVDERRRQYFTPMYDRSYFEADQLMDHGNNIAGLIAAEKGNGRCSSGVAYNASVIPLVVFKLKDAMKWYNPDFNDRYIARALAHKNQDIHIYSNSYNNACPFLQPRISMQDSLITGTTEGRRGKGSIFVFSLGDKADGFHDGNMDFFANSIYTITIGSVAKGGHVPDNAIPCACIIASALSEGNTLDAKNFLTTSHKGLCTEEFKGISAATGIGAGIIALGLQDKLSWRDIQHLLIYTSNLDGLTPILDSISNGAGLKYNPHFGYGMINASAFALATKNWVPVTPQISTIHTMTSMMRLRRKQDSERRYFLVVNVEVKNCNNPSKCILHIEHVVAQIHYTTTRPKLLSIQLCSPLKTCSYLLYNANGTAKKQVDRSWNFTSVQFWGESPVGNWTLVMMQLDRMSNKIYGDVIIGNLTLYIYGTTQNSMKRNNIYFQTPSKTTHKKSGEMVQKVIDLLQSPEKLEEEFPKVLQERFTESITEHKTNNGALLQVLFDIIIIVVILLGVRCYCLRKSILLGAELCFRNLYMCLFDNGRNVEDDNNVDDRDDNENEQMLRR